MLHRRSGRVGWLPLAVAVPMFAVVTPAMSAPTSSVEVKRLRLAHVSEPMGIDDPSPELSWTVAGPGRDIEQTAYEVHVASTAAGLDSPDLWDSGRTDSTRSTSVEYAGAELAARQRAYWKVRVWDEDGHASAWSATASWEMGLPDKSDWDSQWVSAPVVDPVLDGAHWIWHAGDASSPGRVTRYFRGSFTVPGDRTVKSARLVLTADDTVRASVNGQAAIDTTVLATRNHYAWQVGQLADVTESVRAGRNVVSATVANDSSAAGLIARLEVAFADGTTMRVDTDGGWRTATDPEEGWQRSAFDDRAWPDAKVVTEFGSSPWNRKVRLPRTPFLLRTDFDIAKPVVRARLYASALGLYEARLNGVRVGADELTPGWTDYDEKVPYQTYDVTEQLRPGRNALGATVAEGWYAGTLMGGHRYGPAMAFKGQLVVEYEDGSVETLGTDPSWRSTTGGLTRATLYDGEVMDARREPEGWDEPTYDVATWDRTRVLDVNTDMVAPSSPPVRIVETVKPVSVEKIADGVYRYDMGQNFSGRVRLKATGPAGTRIELRHAEWVNDDGSTYFTNLRSAEATDVFILRGTGQPEVYEPRFTTHGFQYVEVRGYPGTPKLSDLVGHAIAADTPASGSFATSDDRLNALQETITWGQRSNFNVVPTDTASRDERLGWAGDIAAYAPTSTFNGDMSAFLRKWVDDLREAQDPDGAVPSVAPRVYNGANGGEGVSGWGDAIVSVPWVLYERYGDEDVLAENYRAMQRWVDYLVQHSDGLLRPGNAYGDWLAVEGSPKPVIDTAYFAHSVDKLADIARVLGHKADAATYDDLINRIRDAFNEAWVASDGVIHGDTQAVYVLALEFDLVPGDLRTAVAGHLVDDIEDHDNHLTTGYLATPYLLDALTEAGHVDVAYRIVQQDSYPGWLYMRRAGGTTFWERWDSYEPNGSYNRSSFNHYALGAVGDWMYRTIAGIAPDPSRPGYRHSVIAPQPGGGLRNAEASLQTEYGTLSSSWALSGGVFRLEVEVPGNATATVRVPTTAGVPASSSDGLTPTEVASDATVFEVGSGRWSFQAKSSEKAPEHASGVTVVEPSGTTPVLPGRAADVKFTLHNWGDQDAVVRPEVAASDGFEASAGSTTVRVPAGAEVPLRVAVRRTTEHVGSGEVTLSVAGDSASVELEATSNWARIAAMTASSTHSKWSPTKTNDGRTEAQHDYSVWNSGEGWNDADKFVWPDILTATWEEPVRVDRVRVFTVDTPQNPAESYGLRDYDIQALVDGSWATVASVGDNVLPTINTKFDMVETTALRLRITDSNDDGYSRVVELQAYSAP